MQPNTMSTTILMLIAMMSQSFLLCTLLHKIILLPLEEEATQMVRVFLVVKKQGY